MDIMRAAIHSEYYTIDISAKIMWVLIKTISVVVLGIFFFRIADNLARKRGLLESSFHH